MNFKRTLAAIAVATLAAGSAHAALFDPDGAGALPAINIGGIDWGPNSFLAVGGTAAVNQFAATNGACPNNSCTFTVYTQANVIGFTAPNGTALPNPAGLNSTFEITMVAAFRETVTGVGTIGPQNVATFATSSTPTNVEFYFSAANSNPLTGFGYNDGRLILNGTLITLANGSFSVNINDPIVALDQSPDGNQYGAQNTVQGQGITGNITVGGLTLDPTFFLTPLATLGYTFTNISQNLPFTTVSPGDCFGGDTDRAAGLVGTGGLVSTCDNAHTNGSPYSGQPNGGGALPNTGAVNGLATGTGPDFVAQTDFNSTLTAVPEPGTLALLGLVLAGVGVASRRRGAAPQA